MHLLVGSDYSEWRAAYVLANVCIADEELRAQVILGDVLVVGERDGANACQHQILCDLVGERFDGDEQDVSCADLLLGLHAPESNLPVIESNLVCSDS